MEENIFLKSLYHRQSHSVIFLPIMVDWSIVELKGETANSHLTATNELVYQNRSEIDLQSKPCLCIASENWFAVDFFACSEYSISNQ